MQWSIFFQQNAAFSHTLTASFRSSIDYIETQVLGSDKHCYSLLLSQFWCTETYFLLQNRNLKFFQKTPFSATRPQAGLRPACTKFGFWFQNPKMLSQSCQYKVKARITFQTTLLEQILHKPSLFCEKKRFLNFQNQPSKIGDRPQAGLRPIVKNRKKNIFSKNIFLKHRYY